MRVLLALVGGFAIGIFLRSLAPFGWPVVGFIMTLAALFVVAAFYTPRKRYGYAALFLLLAALGAARTDLAIVPPPAPFAREAHQKVSLTGVVISDPDMRDANQRITISTAKDGATTNVLVVANRYPLVRAGETITAFGTLMAPQAFAEDNGRVFRYDAFLRKDGIHFLLERASVSVVSEAPWWSLRALAAGVKHVFLNALNAVLPEPYASLAGGIVIGGKQGLGAEVLNAFIISGLVQIVVLSGYNVMVVANAINAGFARVRLSRAAGAIVSGLAIGAFILVAGAGSASVRAGLMAAIALYARATGRNYAASRALLLVVFFMLAWNPLILAFDPGFELSVAATAGLIWLSPLCESWLATFALFARSPFWKNAVATTLAAQIGVLPLLLYLTGNLSFVAIPANLLVLPVVPLTMGFSALAGVVAALFGALATPLAFPAYLLNGYIIFVARIFSALPFAALRLPAFPFWLVALAYALMAYAAYRMYANAALPKGKAAFRGRKTTLRLPPRVSQ